MVANTTVTRKSADHRPLDTNLPDPEIDDMTGATAPNAAGRSSDKMEE
jgi:hypothetical protein